MSEKVLCVDDDGVILDFYRDYLQRQFQVETALSGPEALALVRKHGPYAVVIADMNMPEMNGVELLTQLQRVNGDTVRMMLTADTERDTAVQAINKGHIFQLLTKPCAPEMLAFAIEAGIKQYKLIVAERELLEKTLGSAIQMLTEILSSVDVQSFSSGQTVRQCVRPICERLGYTEIWTLEMAALLANLGVVTIPPATLERSRLGTALSSVEAAMMTRIPEFGRKLLLGVQRLEGVAEIVYFQKKNYDGTGFPSQAMKGEEIPLGARILRVLTDMVQVELSGRVSRTQALSELKSRTELYDPCVLGAAVECFCGDAKESTSRAISWEQLSVGDVLAAAIETVGGMLVIPANNTVSPIVLQKLANLAELSPIRQPVYVKA